ncbi:P-loop containing nucleoside triphosphate hydrolase protein [Pholiota molesta]|nr:P-loop containing nucleoside triphosphate hydrolase protein [Pholiota molesta]
MPATSSQPPRGTRHKLKTLRKSVKKSLAEKLAALEKELEQLPGLIKHKFKKWKNGARDFQLACMRAQVLRRDVLLQAATGSGKTGIAAGPHLLPSSKGKVTLLVSPLLALEEEQVTTFKTEFGLKAIAINSENGGCSPSTMAQIVAGEWQIVLLSPELLTGRKFIDQVLRKPAFGPRCLSIFIDEAHCISHWGASFRKAYSSIGIVRAFLPRDVPIIAVTATLTPLVKYDLLSKLQFDRTQYLFVNIGNDRPNVSQVVRAMEHPANTFHDLDFLIPTTISSPADIPKGFLYSDDIKAGSLITDYLNNRVDTQYRELGLIRPYNATMSKIYRKQVMKLFRDGKIRILVCTDAAGMGCDFPDIDIVVQWKVPDTLSSWVQRAGRAARGIGRQGLAVMIVEKPAFEIAAFPQQLDPHHSQGRGRGRGRGRGYGAALQGHAHGHVAVSKHGVEYAIAHGLKRGMSGGKHDEKLSLDETHISSDMLRNAKGEGIYLYIQTTHCRRQVLHTVFENTPSNIDPLLCCDLCNAKLFNQVRPSPPQQITRQHAPRRVAPVDSVRTALYGWRRQMKTTYWPRGLWAPQGILNDETCELLSSIGPVESQEALALVLEGSWEWWDKLGSELYSFLHSCEIPSLPPRVSRGVKRHPLQEDQGCGPSTSESSPTKRSRTSNQTSNPPALSQPIFLAPSALSSASNTVQAIGSSRRRRGKEAVTVSFPPSSYDTFFSQLSTSAPAK